MPVSGVQLSRSQARLRLEGRARPGAEVRVENASTAYLRAPEGHDTFTGTRAGADGRFSLELSGAVQGDQLRLTASSGGRSPLETLLRVRLPDAERDERKPDLADESLRVVRGRDGLALRVVTPHPRVGEPRLVVELENHRTGERTRFVLDDEGRLPADTRLPGEVGDAFSLYVSDGEHNANLRSSYSGPLHAQPAPAATHGPGLPPTDARGRGGASRELVGPLFAAGVAAGDATQGGLGDCWLVAAASAIAASRPEAIEELFEELPDGSVNVRLQVWSDERDALEEVSVHVDRALYARGDGTPIFGRGGETGDAERMEMWFPLLEKAWASFKGSYEAVRGGWSYQAFEMILGGEPAHLKVDGQDPDALFALLQRLDDEKIPTVASTRVQTRERSFRGTGLVADHAYTVLDVVQTDGERFVRLRNPHGRGEPAGDGRDDGDFLLPLDAFVRCFDGLCMAETPGR